MSPLSFPLIVPAREQCQGRGVVRGYRVYQEASIGGDVVLSSEETRSDDACLEKHPRCSGRFIPRVKGHCHQFPVRRYVEHLPAIPGPRRLCSTPTRDFDAPTGTWKGLDDDTCDACDV